MQKFTGEVIENYRQEQLSRIDPNVVWGHEYTIKEEGLIVVPTCDYRSNNGKSLGVVFSLSNIRSRVIHETSFVKLIGVDELFKKKSFKKHGEISCFKFNTKTENWNTSLIPESLYKDARKKKSGKELEILYRTSDYIQENGSPFITDAILQSRKPTLFICDISKNIASVVVTYPSNWYKMYIPIFYSDNSVVKSNLLPIPVDSINMNDMVAFGNVNVDLDVLINQFCRTGDVLPFYLNYSNFNSIVTSEKYREKVSCVNCTNEYMRDTFELRAKMRPSECKLNELSLFCDKYNRIVDNQLPLILKQFNLI